MAFLILLIIGFIIGVIFVSTAKTGSVKPIAITTVIGLLIGIALGSMRIVPAGHVGIVDFFGRVSPRPLTSGINFINPFAKVVILSIRTHEDKETMNVPSKEGLNIALDL